MLHIINVKPSLYIAKICLTMFNCEIGEIKQFPFMFHVTGHITRVVHTCVARLPVKDVRAVNFLPELWHAYSSVSCSDKSTKEENDRHMTETVMKE